MFFFARKYFRGILSTRKKKLVLPSPKGPSAVSIVAEEWEIHLNLKMFRRFTELMLFEDSEAQLCLEILV